MDISDGDLEIAMEGDYLTMTDDLCWSVEKNVRISFKSPLSLKARADAARMDVGRGVLELEGSVDSRVEIREIEASK